MRGLKHFIETHFGLVLILSCVVGLIIPGLDKLPNQSVVVALAGLMFISCYRLHEGGFKSVRWRSVTLFLVLRYGLLPVLSWLLAEAITPGWATGVFLLAMLPAGVASPAFAAMYGGAVAPAFVIVIISQLAAPFLIPLQFAWIEGVSVGPSPTALFITMVWCIFVPMLVWAAIRKHKSAAFFYAEGRLFSILLVAFVIMLAIAKQRAIILGDIPGLAVPLILTLLCFAVFIIFGWLVGQGPREERIAYAACSSFNNAALGVSLALLHFPPPVILFTAVSEIGWALLPMMFRLWLRRNR